MIKTVHRWLASIPAPSSAVQRQLILSAVIVLSLMLVRWLILSAVWRRVTDVRSRYSWRKGATYMTVAAGLLLVGRIWLAGLGDITTYLGLVSAGVAIALKDPLTSLAAWMFILWRRPFDVGDRIEIDGRRGDVVDVRLFQFTLLEVGEWVGADQTTGRLVHVPNELVFSTPLSNYTTAFRTIWIELGVLVTYESDWSAANDLLLAIAEHHGAAATAEAERQVTRASARFAMPSRSIKPQVFVTVEASGILLTLRLPCDPMKRREVTDAIWRDVLHAINARDDIDFAYPTTRMFQHHLEGKAGMRATPVAAAPPPGGAAGTVT